MPLPLLAALAPAAIGAGTQIFNTLSQNRQNRLNRDFAEGQRAKQYETQLDFWERNNAYNHPSAQMARLREGGLNPHLVYGSGKVAGNTSAAPIAPQQARWQGTAPQINSAAITQPLEAFTDIRHKQAITDNAREQNTLMKQEQELKRIGILTGLLDYDIKDTTKAAVIERVLLDLDKTRSEINNIDARTVRESANIKLDQIKTWQDVIRTNTGVLDSEMRRKLQAAGIKQTEIQTKGSQIVNGINAIKYQLWEDGINPNDPTYLRIIVAAIQKILGGPISNSVK